jgi:hypothetical protein
MPKWLRALATLACLVGVAGFGSCGGSGSSVGGSLTCGNRPPAFTSPATTTVPEDTAGAFYNAAASDADGETVTFSILGGEDAASFRITPAGALSFVVPPDFEAPGDFGGDNVYRVQLGAHDAVSRTTLTLSVVVTDRASVAYRVRRVAAGLPSPVFVAAVPDGSGRVFVVELAGRIRLLTPSNGALAAEAFLDLRGQVSTNGERGLLGFATAPDFATCRRR